MLLIITSTGHGFLVLLTLMTLNDDKPQKLRVFVNFLVFWVATHISRVNCDKMARDRPREPAHEFFSM